MMKTAYGIWRIKGNGLSYRYFSGSTIKSKQ